MSPSDSEHVPDAYADELAAELVLPPNDRAGVCPRCRTWNDDPAAPECTNCADVRRALGEAAVPLDLISLYRKPSLLREWLTGYKGRPDRDEPYNAAYVQHIRGMLDRYFRETWPILSDGDGGIEAITVVPSTERPPPHPLETILSELALPAPVQTILTRGPGELGFRRPSSDAYKASDGFRPMRVLLVDDVYTTGARINSAAFALRAAGHTVAAAVVIARRVNVDYTETARTFWEEQTATPFAWARTADLTNSLRKEKL